MGETTLTLEQVQTLELLTALRDMGAVRVVFNENGTLAGLDFVPPIVTYAGDTDPAPGPTEAPPRPDPQFTPSKAFRELMKGGGL